jgi:hypothetical protein
MGFREGVECTGFFEGGVVRALVAWSLDYDEPYEGSEEEGPWEGEED